MKIHMIFLTILLAGVIGCDGDNGDSGAGGGDPCADLAEAAECPCDYFRVPFDCWMGDPNTFIACETQNCTPPGGIEECGLSQVVQQSSVSIEAVAADLNLQCRISNLASVPICGPEFFFSNLSSAQFATCLCQLAHYANQATEAGVTISGTGPPFSCQSSTSPAPSCIPLAEGNCSSNHDCCDDQADCVDRVCCLPNNSKNCQDNSQCCSGACDADFDPPRMRCELDFMYKYADQNHLTALNMVRLGGATYCTLSSS